MIRKSTWLLSAGLLSVSIPAYAQTAQPQPQPDSAPPTQSGNSQTGTGGEQTAGQQPVDTGDIVITATRRNEALSDVPMAVSAVTAETLENTGATDIRQLNQVSPSLLVSSTSSEGGAAVARIRGIGTVGDNPGLEGSVGVFIDGVYRSRAGMGLTELGPLDRIEVLRGPQGTLFGRNTSAGLISIITARPRFEPEVYSQIDIGNYDLRRTELGITGGLSSTVAARLDGVYMKRDGFLEDVISGRDVNDRNRWLLRGQVLFQPSDDLSVRLVADMTRRREECCAAPYLPAADVVATGSTVTNEPSSIAAIERGLGAVINDRPFEREVSITPGRDYDSDVNDHGFSGEVVYDFGGAELTSITALRYNKYTRGQDADFNNLDILFRASDGESFNRFNTFTQELRLQGNAFANRLDWLVGAYFANEKLRVDDNLSYGADYPRYANCLVGANFAASPLVPDTLIAPGVFPTCFNPTIAGAVLPVAGANAPVLAAFAQLPFNFGPPIGIINFANPPFGTGSGFANIATFLGFPGQSLNGSNLDDSWRQSSRNWALFTHNIFSITDQLKLTAGLRYTHERKRLVGDLADDNVICTVVSASPFAALQQLPCVIPGIPGGALEIRDKLTESKLSGTAVLSFKPTDRLLTYASYSRGYKAGGFNLDRSALFRANTVANGLSGSGAICVSPTQANCQGTVASGEDLRFKPELNDAFELGAKYNGRGLDVNLALFHQVFRDFQLNTFNGLNFIVENINSCSDDLGGADSDNNPTTGACDDGDLRAGVKNVGFELEAFTRPMTDLAVNAGLVMASTKYRDNLVGADGRPLSNALFQLPGRRISNSAQWTATGSVAWTPPIGGSGLRGLVYADVRHMSRFNTGSDLDLEKIQRAFTVVNARVGLHGPDRAWGLELWAQNLLDKNFRQVAFDAPIQGSCTTRGAIAGFCSPTPNRATQLFGVFLGEPRTIGITLRGRLGLSRPAAPVYTPPPAPPPPPVVEQPAPPPPPPPPPPPVERGQRG